jgi:hypothetical protein
MSHVMGCMSKWQEWNQTHQQDLENCIITGVLQAVCKNIAFGEVFLVSDFSGCESALQLKASGNQTASAFTYRQLCHWSSEEISGSNFPKVDYILKSPLNGNAIIFAQLCI